MTISMHIEPADTPELLAPGTVRRPPSIEPDLWARMPWPAKWKAARRWDAAQRQAAANELAQIEHLATIEPIQQRHFGPIATQPHGTNAAYRRHERAGEEPCQPCREGRAAYNRDRYRATRARVLGSRLRDFDEVLVERFIHGDAHWRELTVDERVAAAARLDALGVSRNEIKRRTHLNTYTLRTAWQAAS